MYMAPIVRAKAPVSVTARRLTGLVVLPVSAVFMVPFLAAYAVYAGVTLGIRSIGKAPRALLDMIDYAGTAVLGH